MKTVIHFLIMILSLQLVACGTGDGNPGMHNGTNGANETASQNLISVFCSRLVACNPALESTACINGLGALANVDTELGLSEGAYENWNAITAAERAGTISVNSTAIYSCLNDIGALSCEDPLVQAAYDAQNEAPFAGVAAALPSGAGSCSGVYAP